MHRNLAKTPPLGWNSWDCFGAAVNENQLRENADYMAKYLKEYGWEYIVCDIQWYEPLAKNNDYNNFTELNMDEYGRLMPAENRFPSAACREERYTRRCRLREAKAPAVTLRTIFPSVRGTRICTGVAILPPLRSIIIQFLSFTRSGASTL